MIEEEMEEEVPLPDDPVELVRDLYKHLENQDEEDFNYK